MLLPFPTRLSTLVACIHKYTSQKGLTQASTRPTIGQRSGKGTCPQQSMSACHRAFRSIIYIPDVVACIQRRSHLTFSMPADLRKRTKRLFRPWRSLWVSNRGSKTLNTTRGVMCLLWLVCFYPFPHSGAHRSPASINIPHKRDSPRLLHAPPSSDVAEKGHAHSKVCPHATGLSEALFTSQMWWHVYRKGVI